MRNKYEGFYTLLSCQDNADCLKYLFMFKLIAPASPNLFSLIMHSYHAFFFFHYGYLVQFKKSTRAAQAQLPVIYVSIFQKLVKFCYKIKQPAPPSPVFVHAKLLKSYKKDQIFHCFALWFGLLSFQHCCATVLRKISLASLNQPSTESFEE